MNQGKWYFKRIQMLENQIRARNITDKEVLRAMQIVPRHLFVPKQLEAYSYEDRPLDIGYEQTISQPYIVAFMTEALKIHEDSKVLEIGTGSGYQTAILSAICQEVYTIEIVKELAESTKKLFKQLGYTNIHTKIGNGYKGWQEAAPFDAVIVTAAADYIVDELLTQLKVGGVMVMPLKENEFDQTLVRISKIDANNNYKRESLLPVRFVPMTGSENN
jgi:protein-L-isoaspartate(D-aspartate) O-methyltransferase